MSHVAGVRDVNKAELISFFAEGGLGAGTETRHVEKVDKV